MLGLPALLDEAPGHEASEHLPVAVLSSAVLAACRENISRAQQKYLQCVTLRLLVVGGDGDGLELAGACAHFGLQLPSPNSDT